MARRTAAALPVLLTFLFAAPSFAASHQTASAQQPRVVAGRQCHWWQFVCRGEESAGLPPEAPREGTVVTVDLSTNTAYLYRDGALVVKSPVATGRETILRHGSQVWAFHTPRGHLRVLRKIENPVWNKPDWAFVEAGEPIPPRDSPKRLLKNHLGRYALDLGDGILIHGTNDASSIGRRASHGCLRVSTRMLATLYGAVAVGTDVFIFESRPAVAAVSASGDPEARTTERHSDLDLQ